MAIGYKLELWELLEENLFSATAKQKH